MKKMVWRVVCAVLALLVVLAACPSMAFAATKWVEISTIEQLYNIRNDLTANYRLVKDIDLTAATAKGGDWDFMGNGWNPIGSKNVYSNDAFTGTFDGNGYAIRGLRIEQTTLPGGASTVYVGLFANVAGTVKNLSVYGSISAKNASYIGAIAAYVDGGTIENCQNNAPVSSPSAGSMGGIVGYLCDGVINRCLNTGNIISTSDGTSYNIGGIAGMITNGGTWVGNCYNIGSISAKAKYNGNYSHQQYLGGIAGHSTGSANIFNCYNRGQTTNGSSTGYSITMRSSSTITDCYYLAGSGTTNTGATSLTDAQMRLMSLYSGFDFENVWVIDADSLYPYPQLRGNLQDLDTAADITFTISTLETTALKADDTFAIEIRSSAIADIACVEFKFGYDPTKFEFVSGEAAGYLAEMDMSNIDIVDESVWSDPAKAEVWITGMGEAQSGAEDEVIATLTFKALTDINTDCEFVAVATPIAIDSNDVEYVAIAKNGGLMIIVILGDINSDGGVDMIDAYSVYRAASTGQASDEIRTLADMNGDGAIDMRDAFKVYRIASGQVTE